MTHFSLIQIGSSELIDLRRVVSSKLDLIELNCSLRDWNGDGLCYSPFSAAIFSHHSIWWLDPLFTSIRHVSWNRIRPRWTRAKMLGEIPAILQLRLSVARYLRSQDFLFISIRCTFIMPWVRCWTRWSHCGRSGQHILRPRSKQNSPTPGTLPMQRNERNLWKMREKMW